jgi:hypothetical protein
MVRKQILQMYLMNKKMIHVATKNVLNNNKQLIKNHPTILCLHGSTNQRTLFKDKPGNYIHSYYTMKASN